MPADGGADALDRFDTAVRQISLTARAATPRRQQIQRRRPVLVPYLAAGGAYLLLSVILWWHVWTSHPTMAATCGCGDPSLFQWFLEWPAYALTHFHSPVYSTALFHPSGVNLLAQTSVLAIGIPLTPITLLFGPVASLNVANTLSPVLSAMAAFWLLNRWVKFRPAAFAGGLLFGFSPFVLGQLPYSHLMTASLVVLPLALVCLDELFIRQRYSPVRIGAALGLLAVVQFFVSTEVLVIMMFGALIGTAMLVLYGLRTNPEDLRWRARKALPGLGVAAGVMVVLLAYPTWYALPGRAHLSGAIWPNIPAIGGFVFRSFIDPNVGTQPNLLLDIGGYFGKPLPSPGYVGWGLLLVVFGGLLLWRRDRRLWFFTALAIICAFLSLGARRHTWVPWQIFDRVPVLKNVIEQRFAAVMFLALAAILAIAIDHAHQLHLPNAAWGAAVTDRARRVGAAGAALAVGLLALLPMLLAFVPALPFYTQAVTLPPWFERQAPHLPAGEVLLAYPAPFSGIQSAMTWQAVNKMAYAQAGGGGPQGTPQRAGKERPGFEVLRELGFGFSGQPAGTPTQVTAVRQALSGWGVTMVVIPNAHGSAIVVGHDAIYAAAFMTEVLGARPTFVADAFVWHVNLAMPPRLLHPGALQFCTLATHKLHVAPILVTVCAADAPRLTPVTP